MHHVGSIRFRFRIVPSGHFMTYLKVIKLEVIEPFRTTVPRRCSEDEGCCKFYVDEKWAPYEVTYCRLVIRTIHHIYSQSGTDSLI